MKLLLDMKLLELLLENRIDFLKDKYIPLIENKCRIPLVQTQHFYTLINKDIINNLI